AEIGGARLVTTLWHDLRYALRSLRRETGFTLVAVLTLALGIGANTAIFSVVRAVLLRPLPYTEADRLVVGPVSPPDFRDLRDANHVFDRMAIWASNLYSVEAGDEVSQVMGATVSPDFIPMLGRPLIGRAFRADEDRVPLVVLSHDFWMKRYGGDPRVVGTTLRLNRAPYTIVGVMPPEFEFPSGRFKFWVPFGVAMASAPEQGENRQLRIFR